jgi:hypothetical protein
MHSTIILIDDPSKINEITKYTKSNTTKIFSLNYSTHKALEKSKIKHEIGESYLNSKELKNLDNYLYDLILNWHQNPKIKNYVSYDSLNLAKMLEVEIVQFFVPFFLSAKSSLKIIEIEKPSLIITATKINKFLKHYCDKANIEINSIHVSETGTLKLDNFLIKVNIGSIPVSLKISRKKFLFVKKFFEKFLYNLFNLNYNSDKSNSKSIILFDFNAVNYENLLNELSKMNKKIILFNTRKPVIWNLSSLKIILKTRCKIANSQNYDNEIKQKFELDQKEFFNNLTKLWDKTELFESIFLIDSIPFWQSIKTSFTSILEIRFRESILKILVLKSLLKKSNTSVVLEWAESAQEEREMIHVAKQHDIKIIFLQHAMMQISKGHIKFGSVLSHLAYPLQSDMQLVWGEPAKIFCHDQKSNKNALPIGSPRHDKFFNHKKIPSKPIILFAPTGTTSFSCEHSTTKTILDFYEIVKNTCKIASKISSKELVMKPHPSTTVSNEVIHIAKEIDSKIKITFTTNILDLINECELLITTNNSTIAVEAMMLGKPVISLQTENWSLQEDIAISNAIVSITDTSELKNSIEKILFDEKYRTDLLNNSKKFLDKHFSNPGDASKNIYKILTQII